MSSVWDDRRGQSEVLGTVMLVGIVVLAALAVAGLALGAFGGTQDQADREAIEQTLLDLRSSAAAVAIEGESSRVLHIEPPANSQMMLNESAGGITIEHLNYRPGKDDDPEELYSQDRLGSLQIQQDDVVYGFEAGGIFRYEDGRSQMVAPPTIVYRDLTAVMPILRLEGEGAKAGPTSISISPGEHVRPAFPSDKSYQNGSLDIPYDNPVMNGSIQITVQSKFYQGWEQFFEQYTDGNVTTYPDEQKVVATIASIEHLAYTDSIVALEGVDPRGGGSIDDWNTIDYLPDPAELIESEIAEARDENDNEEIDCIDEEGIDEPCTLEPGTYFIDGDLDLTGEHTFNTDGGNISLVIDGGLYTSGETNVTITGDSDYGVTWYIRDDFNYQGTTTMATDNEAIEAHRNVMIIGGDMVVPGDGTLNLDGVIYAPNAHLDTGGNVNFRGSMFADEVTLRGNFDVQFDPELEDRVLDLTGTPTPVMFLHITENTAVVDID